MAQVVVHDFRFASFLRKAKKWQSLKSKRIGGEWGGGEETCKLETLYISLSPPTFVCNRVWMMVFRMETADDVLLSELAINHQLQYSEDTYLLAHLDPKPSYHHHMPKMAETGTGESRSCLMISKAHGTLRVPVIGERSYS